MPTHLTQDDYAIPNGVSRLNSTGLVPMSTMGIGDQPVGAILGVQLDDTGHRRQSWISDIIDSDGKILMSALPQNITDALNALLEAQKETNELLFELLSKLSESKESKELTNVP